VTKKKLRFSDDLKFSVLDENNQPTITANARHLFYFEYHRQKSEPQIQVEGEVSPVVESTGINVENAWSETFGGVHDEPKYGPQSIGMDFTFHRSLNVYGIPEHATDLSLKTTTGDNGYSEPYRMYNLDVFEYELDEPMALYGHVPMMMSHSKDLGSVGLYWHNTAETWIDIEKDASGQETHTHWFSETGIIDIFFFNRL